MSITNFDNCKNSTEVKKKVRELVIGQLIKFYSELVGEENVSQVGPSEISIAIGEITLANGEVPEICVNLKPTVKDWEDRHTEKNEFLAYERLTAEDTYKLEQKSKAEKAKAKKSTTSKSEKQKALAEREKELDEVAKRVREKREKEVAELRAKASK